MLKNLNETELQWVVPKIEKSLLWVFQSVCQWVSDRQRASYELNPLGQLKKFSKYIKNCSFGTWLWNAKNENQVLLIPHLVLYWYISASWVFQL